ncbi:hypothetical protein B5807_05464 [Epicoccum nigrum]|uniref:Uncharacterized protein n=1 Tax=Epicoccum nigrum TaxID=105696 RepID=A0A1Y2LZR7_EPING|nr:hypothetical protein B5807_05464 [Epicoccum nigrum]
MSSEIDVRQKSKQLKSVARQRSSQSADAPKPPSAQRHAKAARHFLSMSSWMQTPSILVLREYHLGKQCPPQGHIFDPVVNGSPSHCLTDPVHHHQGQCGEIQGLYGCRRCFLPS